MSTGVQAHTIANREVELYARLRVVDHTRPTVILLCGLGFHTFEYEPLATELCRSGINTVSFDYRGHGRSTGSRGRWTLDELATDAACAIAHAQTCGLRRIHLVGNSLGGMVGILAGSRCRDVLSIVASNTPARTGEFLLTRPRRALYRVALPFSRLVPLRISVNHFYSYGQLTDDRDLAERIDRDRAIARARRLAMPTYRQLLDVWDGPTAIRRAGRPVLIIQGTRDRLQPGAQSEELFDAARDPKQIQHIDAGHLPHLDATTGFAGLLTTWIDTVDPGAPGGVNPNDRAAAARRGESPDRRA